MNIQVPLPLGLKFKHRLTVLLLFVLCFGLSSVAVRAQVSLHTADTYPYSFEDITNENWRSSTSTAVATSDQTHVRTGLYSLKIAATSNSTGTTTAVYFPQDPGTTTNGNGGILSATTTLNFYYICWLYVGTTTTSNQYAAGVGTQATNSATGTLGSGSYGNSLTLVNSTWQRLVGIVRTQSGSTKYAFPLLRRITTDADAIWMDDGIFYGSPNAISAVDTFKPNNTGTLAASQASSTSINLAWTASTGDDATVGTGLRGTIILRTTATGATAPILNDQGIYAAAGGSAGASTALDAGGHMWTVVNGAGTTNLASATDGSLTGGSTYTYAVAAYDKLYNYSTPQLSSSVTLGSGVTVSTTSLTSFGSLVVGNTSAQQSFTVSGSSLTADVFVTPPTGYQLSLTSGGPYSSAAIDLAPSSGTLATTTIYAVFAPPAPATGATVGNITIASAGASTQNVAVTGTSIATEPTSVGTLAFGAITNTSIVLNYTPGNGNNCVIVAYTSAPGFVPTDGTAVSGTESANYTTATNQTGNGHVVYDGVNTGANALTVTGLSLNTPYYFAVYEYNVGTGASQNYLTSTAATNNTTTTGPALAVTGTLTTFGAQAINTASAQQTINVGGTNLTGNITITPPTGFQLSTTSGSGYATSAITLTPDGNGTVAATPIYVIYEPTVANGPTSGLSIAAASASATTVNTAVSGTAIAAEPTGAGTITFGTITPTSIVVNFTPAGTGAGTNRVIVAYAGTPTYAPADGTAPPAANSVYSSGTNQNNGIVVYSGTGSGAGVVTVTGLTASTTYYFADYEYNIGTSTSQNYLTASPATASVATGSASSPFITVTAGTFTGTFGNIVAGNTSAEQVYTVSGNSLTNDIIVTPPSGFQLSLSTGGPYSSTPIDLAQTGGTVANTNIYAVFVPSAATGAATGNITNTSTGATEVDAAVTGNALATEPTAVGTLAFGTVTNTTAVLNYTPAATGGGTNRIIVAYTTTPGYTPVDGAAVSGTIDPSYTTATNQTGNGHVVYDGTGSGAGVVTVTGLTSGTSYSFKVYEYNAGTGTSQNYYSTAATGTTTTASPVITATGTLTAFGNVVTGSTSAEQSYSVSGSNLNAGITVTAPAGFQVSTTTGTGYASSVVLPQTGGAVSATTIYVVYAPASATGATTANITNASTGATTVNKSVSGNAIATEPTTTPTITFGTVTATSAVLNFSGGNGTNHLIVANIVTPTYTLPADGVAPGSASTAYTTANQVVYSGTGSTVTVTGLTPGSTYYFTEYEYNVGTGTSQNYLATPTTVNTTTPLGTHLYMLNTATAPATLASWTTDVTGTAATGTPTSFSTAAQIFHISNTGITLATTWTVSGTNSKVVIDSSFTATSTLSATVDVSAGQTFTYGATSSTNLVMGTLDTSSTVIYNATSSQTIAGGTYGNLQILAGSGGSGTKKVLAPITVNGDLTLGIGQSAGFDLGTNSTSVTLKGDILTTTATASGGVAADNVINTGTTGTLIFAGTNQTVADGVFSGSKGGPVQNLTINAGDTVTLAGTTNVPSITGALINNGDLIVGTNTLTMNTTTAPAGTGYIDASAGTLAIAASVSFPAGYTIADKNLTLTAGTATFANGITVNGGTVTRVAGTLAAAPTYTGTVNVSIGGSVTSGNELTPVSGSINNLTLTTGTYTLATSPIINGNLSLAGTLAVGTNTLTLKGNVTRTSGGITSATGTVVFSGSSAQAIGGSSFTGNIGTLAINNASGVTQTTSSLVVANALNLTSGLFTVPGITEGVAATTSAVNAAGGTLSANPTYAGTVNVTTNGTFTSGRELTPTGTINSLTVASGTYTLAGTLSAPTWGSLAIASGANLVAGTSSITLSATGANISGTFTHGNTTGFSGGAATAIKSANSPVITLNPGSTVVYTGSGTPPITAGSYANLTIMNAGTLSGNATVNGTLSLSGGLLSVGNNTLTIADFSGSAANALSVTGGSTVATTGALTGALFFDAANNTLGTLNIGGNTTLGNALQMAAGATPGTVNVAAGTLTTGGNLTLLSDANGTARIAQITGAVSGNVNIQRFVPAQRGYRLLGHPYTSNLDLSQLSASFDITGISGGATCTGTSPSVFSYTPGSSPVYTGITNGTAAFPAAQASGTVANGVLAFVRGAKGEGCSTGAYTPSNVTFTTAAGINQGNITETVPSGGWNLIANPYPSQVSLNNVTGMGSLNAIVVVQPGVQNGGNTYTNGTNYVIVTDYTSYVLPINGAFLAQANTGDVSVVFHESDKVADAPATGILKTAGLYPTMELSIFNGGKLWDAWRLNMKQGATGNAGEPGDIVKMSNAQFNISSLSADGQSLAWDARDESTIKDGDIISMNLSSNPKTTYTMQVSDYSLPANKTVYLHDKYTNSYTLLSNGTTYPFTVDANAASQGNSRMELLFNDIAGGNTGVGNVAGTAGRIQVSPNPATNVISLSYPTAFAGAKEISILNAMGQVVRTIVSADKIVAVDISALPGGMYVVKTTAGENVATGRFIKN